MKKILIGALALSLATGSLADAQPYHDGRQTNDRGGGSDNGGDQGRAYGRDGGGDRGQGDGHGDARDHGQGYGHDNGRFRDQNYSEHRGWGRDYNGPHHWRRGERMGYNDWNGARRIDYREYHLRHPPRGYEWRETNGRYILVAVATGLIASIIFNSGR